jgi:hypothetical protein
VSLGWGWLEQKVQEGLAAVVECEGPGVKSVTMDVLCLLDEASPKAEPARARMAATSWACIVAGGSAVGIEPAVDGWMYELTEGDALMEMQLQMVDDVKRKEEERQREEEEEEEGECWGTILLAGSSRVAVGNWITAGNGRGEGMARACGELEEGTGAEVWQELTWWQNQVLASGS